METKSFIREYINSHLLEPLNNYPTIVQATMIEIITQKLEKLYEYTIKFPEIVSPNSDRLDILKIIADQFLFKIRDDARLQEQIDILNNILYVYRRRGSVDTIENMWRYYGGTLPKDIKIKIPSYDIFRYNVSKLSGTHHLQDGDTYRTGIYDVIVYNSTYPVDDLKEFMLSELVAAGTEIRFSNNVHMEVLDGDDSSSSYLYNVYDNTNLFIEMEALYRTRGFRWNDTKSLLSGYNKNIVSGSIIDPADPGYRDRYKGREPEIIDSYLSGKDFIFMDIVYKLDMDTILMNNYYLYNTTEFVVDHTIFDGFTEYFESEFFKSSITMVPSNPEHGPKGYNINFYPKDTDDVFIINRLIEMYYTYGSINTYMINYLFDKNTGELINSNFPGYFILGESLLGEEVI